MDEKYPRKIFNRNLSCSGKLQKQEYLFYNSPLWILFHANQVKINWLIAITVIWLNKQKIALSPTLI